MMSMNPSIDIPHLSDRQFSKLSAFIRETVGIFLPETKKTMLESRLLKRLRILSFVSFDEYIKYLFDRNGLSDELHYLIDRATTHKTHFFREKLHFEILKDQIMPYWREQGIRRIRVLSAACSTGEEVYSLAMLFQDEWNLPGETFEVIGFDVSPAVIDYAEKAVYPYDCIGQIPQKYMQQYLLKSKEGPPYSIRVTPPLRRKVSFKCWNIIDKSIPIDDYHLIFCRNMLIYFTREDQVRIARRLITGLHDHGFLTLGVSEPMLERGPDVKTFGSTIYQKEIHQ